MNRYKYYYNPDTLLFEKVEKPLSIKIKKGLMYVAVLALLFIGGRIALDSHITSPKVNHFSQENIELREAYKHLNQKINLAEGFLVEIQKRDEVVYRSVFELDPIPPSVREAGFGGSEEYYSELYNNTTEFVTNTASKLDKLSTKARVQSVSLSDIYSKAKKKRLLLERIPSIQPISPADRFWLTSSFGYRRDPFHKGRRIHHGIDLAGQTGLKIYATGAGKVELAEYNRYGYGKEVIIDHGFGYKSIYAHLDKILVSKGDRVKRGELVGTLGNTGRSTGPHLHYEIRKNNRPVNPMYFYFEDLTAEEYNEIVVLNNNE